MFELGLCLIELIFFIYENVLGFLDLNVLCKLARNGAKSSVGAISEVLVRQRGDTALQTAESLPI